MNLKKNNLSLIFFKLFTLVSLILLFTLILKTVIVHFPHSPIGVKIFYITLIFSIICSIMTLYIIGKLSSLTSNQLVRNPIFIFINKVQDGRLFEKIPKNRKDFIKEAHKLKLSFIPTGLYVKVIKQKCDNAKNLILKYYNNESNLYEKSLYLDNLLYQDSSDLTLFILEELERYCNPKYDNEENIWILRATLNEYIEKTSIKKDKDIYFEYLKSDKIGNKYKYSLIKICGKYRLYEACDKIIEILYSINEKDYEEYKTKYECIKALYKMNIDNKYYNIFAQYSKCGNDDYEKLCKRILKKIDN